MASIAAAAVGFWYLIDDAKVTVLKMVTAPRDTTTEVVVLVGYSCFVLEDMEKRTMKK